MSYTKLNLMADQLEDIALTGTSDAEIRARLFKIVAELRKLALMPWTK